MSDAGATRARVAVVWLRSVVFFAGMVLTVIVYATSFAIVAPLFPLRRRFQLANGWVHLFNAMLRAVCRLTFEVEGLDRVPAHGRVIYFSKHQSTWETFAFQSFLRPYCWVIKRELLWLPFFGWGLAQLRPIALRRHGGHSVVQQLVAQGRQRLAAGLGIMVFPEGTRIPAGRQVPFKLGGAVLAEQSQYPVIPIAHNAGCYWSRRGLAKWPGTIRVVIGEPIDTLGLSAAEINRRAKTWIDATTAALEREAGLEPSASTAE